MDSRSAQVSESLTSDNRFLSSSIDSDSSTDLSFLDIFHSSMNNQYKYLLRFLNNSRLSPARIAIAMNFKESSYPSPKPNYRLRRKQSQEAKDRHNMRRKIHRILKHDISNDYIKMMFNILNSGDFQLFRKFLTHFFVPDCIFVKSVYSSSNKKYQTKGTDNIYELFHLACECLPDYVIRIKESKSIRDANNNIIVTTHFNGSSNKFKYNLHLFYHFLQRIQSYLFVSSSFSSDDNLKQNMVSPPKETTINNNIPFDLNKDTFYCQHLSGLSLLKCQISNRLLDILSNISPLYFFQHFLPLCQQSDSMIMISPFMPGIHIKANCQFVMHINEHHLVYKLEYFVDRIQLEVTSS